MPDSIHASYRQIQEQMLDFARRDDQASGGAI
jgi:hypothetical protein